MDGCSPSSVLSIVRPSEYCLSIMHEISVQVSVYLCFIENRNLNLECFEIKIVRLQLDILKFHLILEQ